MQQKIERKLTSADARRRDYLESLNSKRTESKQQKIQRRIMSLKNLQKYLDELEPDNQNKLKDTSPRASPLSKTHAKS